MGVVSENPGRWRRRPVVTLVSFLLCLVYVDVLTTSACSNEETVSPTPGPDAQVTSDGPAVDTKPADTTVDSPADSENDTALADAPTDTTSDGLTDVPVDGGVDADLIDAPPSVDADLIDAPPSVDADLIDAPPPVDADLIDAPAVDAEFFVDAAPDAAP